MKLSDYVYLMLVVSVAAYAGGYINVGAPASLVVMSFITKWCERY